MSMLLNQPSKLCFRKPVLVRSSPRLSNGFSSSEPQSPPCFVMGAKFCGDGGKLVIKLAIDNNNVSICLEDKKVPMELVYNNELNDPMVTIGSSHGWVATLKDDEILCLQDDLNPLSSCTDPKRISLPPLVTLPHCQTQVVTNVSMSSSSPEDEDCVVAVKFLGPQLSFCRPAQSNSEWTNVRIANPCFFSSRVMYSKKDDMFRIAGSGGNLIGSWDLRKHIKNPKLQSLQFRNLPKLKKAKWELMDSCSTSEHLVESPAGETFLVKWYRKPAAKTIKKSIVKMETEALMVFKLDEEGNAIYTKDIGDLCIFLSKSEPICVPSSSFPGLGHNKVTFYDVDDAGTVSLDDSSIVSVGIPTLEFKSPPYIIPPQKLELVDWN